MLPAPPLDQDHYLQHVSAPRQHIRATFSTIGQPKSAGADVLDEYETGDGFDHFPTWFDVMAGAGEVWEDMFMMHQL